MIEVQNIQVIIEIKEKKRFKIIIISKYRKKSKKFDIYFKFSTKDQDEPLPIP